MTRKAAQEWQEPLTIFATDLSARVRCPECDNGLLLAEQEEPPTVSAETYRSILCDVFLASKLLSLAFGKWQRFKREGRVAWLRAACTRHFAFPYAQARRPSGTVLVFDCRVVDDFEALLCAIGEAINGPAGYFGASLEAFDDCLVGGFGIEPPWTLRWQYSDIARRALGHEEALRHARERYETSDVPFEDVREAARAEIEALARGEGETLFESIVSTLRFRGIVVELE
jgi:hypothetical protein